MNDCPVHLGDNGDYWKAHWRDLGGKQHSKSLGAKKKLSKRAARVLCQRMASEMMILPSKREAIKAPPIGKWLDRYLKERETELGEATHAGHTVTCKYLKECFQETLSIDRISRDSAAAWRHWLGTEKGVSETTVCGHVRTAKVIFNRAAERDLIPFSPFDRLKGNAPMPDIHKRHYVSRTRDGARRSDARRPHRHLQIPKRVFPGNAIDRSYQPRLGRGVASLVGNREGRV